MGTRRILTYSTYCVMITASFLIKQILRRQAIAKMWRSMGSNNNLQIRNSIVDFLVFTRDAGDEGIEVR